MKHIFYYSLLIFLLFIGCSNNDQQKSDTLRYFIPQTDESGEVIFTATGDTVWHTIPAFNFIDENGNEVTEKIMENKIVVVDYFFTTCPTICIAMTQNLGKVQEHFKNNPNLKLLSHTVNPEKDTPEVLKAYAQSKKADPDQWHFLTGKKEALYSQARNGYFITTIEGDGGPNDFIHSEKMVLIDRDGHIRGFFRGTVEEDMQDLIKSIEALLKT